MKVFQQSFEVNTSGRGMLDITDSVNDLVLSSSVKIGISHVFLHHTSASLSLCENTDPDVQGDLERFFSRLVPDADPIYLHTDEGPDDMSAHVRSVLTTNCITIPIAESLLSLGRWQGIYLWEHRNSAYKRKVTVTILG